MIAQSENRHGTSTCALMLADCTMDSRALRIVGTRLARELTLLVLVEPRLAG